MCVRRWWRWTCSSVQLVIQPMLAITRGPGISPLSMRSPAWRRGRPGLPARSTAVVIAAHQELTGGHRHHLRVVRPMRAVPVLVVGVSEDVQVHVDVDQSRHDGHPGGIDDLGALGHVERRPGCRRPRCGCRPPGRSRRAGAVPSCPSMSRPPTMARVARFGLRIPLAVEHLRRRRRLRRRGSRTSAARRLLHQGRRVGIMRDLRNLIVGISALESRRREFIAGRVSRTAVGTRGTRWGSRARSPRGRCTAVPPAT